MAGLLPAARPTATSYGPTLSNDSAVEDPTRELDAENVNKAFGDVAFLGAVSPLAIVRISSAGAVLSAWGLSTGAVSASRSAAGRYQVDVTGIAVTFAVAHVQMPAGSAWGTTRLVRQLIVESTTQVKVETGDNTADADAAFALLLW